MPSSGGIKAGQAYVEAYVKDDEFKKELDDDAEAVDGFSKAVSSSVAASSYASQAGWAALALAGRRNAEESKQSFGIVGQAAATVQNKVAGAFAVVTGSIVGPLQATSSTLQSWGAAIAGWGQKITAAGAGAKAFFAGALGTFTEMGSTVATLSQRTKVGAEALTTLGFAARVSGGNAAALESGFGKLSDTLAGASPAALEGQRALGLVGLSVKELLKLSPDAQFRAIADRLSRISDPAQRAAGAMMIFGHASESLLPLIEQGAAGIESLEDKARSLGLEMRGEDAASALSLKQALTTLWDTVKMATFAIGQPLAEAMQKMVEMATKVVGRVSQWIKQNKDLIVSANSIASIVTGAGTAITVFGGIVSGAGIVLGEIAAVAGALLSPIALATAAVAGLGYYLATNTETGKTAVDALSQTFSDMKSSAMETFGAISAALAAGDINLAIEILTTTLKAKWAEATAYLMEKWEQVKSVAVPILTVIGAEAAAAWEEIRTRGIEAWDTIQARAVAFAESVQGLWKGIKETWAEAMLNLTQYWDRVKPIADMAASAAGHLLGGTATAASLAVFGGAGIPGLGGGKGPGAGAGPPAEAADGGPSTLDKIIEGAKDGWQALKDKIAAAGSGSSSDTEDKYGVAAARQAAADALARARELKDNASAGGPAGGGLSVDFSAAAKAAAESKTRATPGLGYADARSTEGFKAIAVALRQGRDDPQRAAATSLRSIADDTAKNQRWLKQIRDDIHSQQGFGF
jgi:hypothetical protein